MTHPFSVWTPSSSVDEDVDKLAHTTDLIVAFLKQGDLIGDGGLSEVIHPQRKVGDGGE